MDACPPLARQAGVGSVVSRLPRGDRIPLRGQTRAEQGEEDGTGVPSYDFLPLDSLIHEKFFKDLR